MAITRCPYCHAIIDENDKYCNNCGTQLLFNEDEEIEEEIPGEKIIDADVEEKDYTVDEPEGEKRPTAAKDLDSEIDEELEEELHEDTEELALDELVAQETQGEAVDGVTEEVILVDEIESVEAKGKPGSEALGKDDTAEVKKPAPEAEHKEDEGEEEEEDAEDEELASELEEEIEEDAGEGTEAGGKPEKEEETREYSALAAQAAITPGQAPEPPGAPPEDVDVEYVSGSTAPDEAATAGEAALRPVTFDTKELDDLGKTVELSGEKVDKFIEIMAGEKTEPPPSPPEPSPQKIPEPPTGTLPPWASTMKGAPVFPEDTGPVETRKLRGGEPATPDTEEEVEIFPRRRPSDSTIGLPEKVSQVPLPFERSAAQTGEGEEEGEGGEEEAEEEKGPDLTPEEVILPAGQVRPARPSVLPGPESEAREPARRGIEAAEESEEPAPRRPFSFSVFFKSKSFDVLFVGLFWLVALWLAAFSMGMTLFDILGSMSGSMLLLYAVLVFLYFFLFKFFLGETLGDRLFRPRE
jgi:hypothetical protein